MTENATELIKKINSTKSEQHILKWCVGFTIILNSGRCSILYER